MYLRYIIKISIKQQGDNKMTAFAYEADIRNMIKDLAPAGTQFRWSNAKRRFGSCSYRTNRATGEHYGYVIKISYPLANLNTWEEVKKVVIHEIAHARTPDHGHDRVWQRECIQLGGDGQRCYTNEEHGGVVKSVQKTWIGTCPICGNVVAKRFRRTDCYHPCIANKSKKSIVWTPYKAA